MSGSGIELTFSGTGFSSIGESVKAALAEAVSATACEVLATAQQEILQGEKSGRTYQRGATTRSGGSRNTKLLGGLGLDRVDGKEDGDFITGYKFHRASAPGEAPANDLGALANNAGVVIAEGGMAADVEFRQEYAMAMEFGTVDVGGHIEPRPFLTPATKAHEDSFRERCEAALAKGMAEGAA